MGPETPNDEAINMPKIKEKNRRGTYWKQRVYIYVSGRSPGKWHVKCFPVSWIWRDEGI